MLVAAAAAGDVVVCVVVEVVVAVAAVVVSRGVVIADAGFAAVLGAFAILAIPTRCLISPL